MNNNFSLRNYKEIRLILSMVFALLVVFSMLPHKLVGDIIKEGSIIETLTVVVYAIVVLFLLQISFQQRASQYLPTSALVTLLALRELDFHTRFTTMGIFKTKFYISPEVPQVEKIVVSLLVLVLFLFLLAFIKHHFASFLCNLQQGKPVTVAIAFGIGSAVLSKIIDNMSELFHPLCFWYDPVVMTRAIEEVLELAIPCFFMVAIYYFNGNRWLMANKFKDRD